MGKIVVMNNPLIKHYLTIIRDKNTKPDLFRQSVARVVQLMAVEFTQDLPTKKVVIETPNCKTEQEVLAKNIILAPILRAGLGFSNPLLEILPDCKVAHVGMYRDEETHEPVWYYVNIPDDISNSVTFVLDPMLATGNSAIESIKMLKGKGLENISYVGLIGAREGLNKLHNTFPDVDIYLAALDEEMNENCYIVPGLGDCGDRLFGTK